MQIALRQKNSLDLRPTDGAAPWETMMMSRGGWLKISFAPLAQGFLRLTLQPVSQFSRQARDLSTREKEIAHWMTEGKTNPEIALILGISPRTVDKHRENIFAKLGVENRMQLIRSFLEK